jgi:hypothetical protein
LIPVTHGAPPDAADRRDLMRPANTSIIRAHGVSPGNVSLGFGLLAATAIVVAGVSVGLPGRAGRW